MATQDTVRWLQVMAATVIVFGLVVAGTAHPVTAGVTRFLVDLVFWPVDWQQSVDAPATRLLCAEGGGIMAAWGLTLWMVATRL